MDFLNDINEKTIIVCPYNVKNKLLEVIDTYNRLINVKIYSLDELKRFVYFDYDVDAILYLMDKYKYTYEIAKMYIDNLYFIEDKKYDIEKLDFLVNIKKELDENNLLIYNSLFLKNASKVLVFGYDYLDSFSKRILSNFNYKVIDKKSYADKINVYKCSTLEDEILFVINKIIELINNGISVNNIYLLNADSNYNNTIIRLFNMFNTPIDIECSSNLLSTTIGKKTFEYLKENKSFSDALEYIKTFGLDNSNNENIYNKILNIFNKYNDLNYSFETILDAVNYDLKNITISNNNLKNKVRVGTLNNNYFTEYEYIFLLGFNQGSIPIIYKDEDYINDSLKEIIGLDSVNVINKLENNACLNNIKSIKNITITYKLNHGQDEFYPSNLLSEEIFEEKEIEEISTINSLLYSNIKLAEMLDDLIKYDKKNPLLEKYYNSLKIRFMEYDNKFKGIDKNKYYNYISNELVLSYSTIDTYYRCGFRYYLDNVLILNKYEETFDTLIGSLFHFVLSHVYNDDFDLDKDYDYYLKDREFDNKEKFYLKKLRKELKIICNRLLEFKNDTGLTNVFTEKKITIDKSSDIKVIFKGFVDKIMYKEYDSKTLVSIIDYKTGNTDIDIYNSIYGIDMQLLIYLYLISKSNLFDNYACVGFYLQRILSGEVNIEKDKTYLEIKNNNLKLAGYSTDDVIDLSRFDPTYENSDYIKGMKTTKSGFSSYAKVLSNEEMNKFIDLVDEKINTSRDLILNCKFDINPKWISNDAEITGCKYCSYRDICNRKNEDIINLKKYKDLSFLEGGDNNA